MLTTRILNTLRTSRKCLPVVQNTLSRRTKFDKVNKPDENISTLPLGDIGSKYKIFDEKESEVILDIYDDDKSKYGDLLPDEEEPPDPLDGLNLQRGLRGVYEIEDLLEVLKRENAQDIFVATVPQEINYVDFMCVVSGKSQKHMQAMAQFVRRVYKKKRSKTDIIPKIEGGDSKDWIALDLGNIALHIFSKEARVLYDLDSLWSVGPQFDKEYNRQDPVVEMLEKHSIYLQDLQPAS